ncbi:MAG: hypothetical protein MSC30_18440 [Gaiellaceae bacterium MAG52_C11]|nr:hypothetical protein [Candidatus Gaiellasilicea maunaloa]
MTYPDTHNRPTGRKEANMASSTTTRKPPTETENGWTATTLNKRSTGADRNADIVLVAAVIAMGLLAGLFYAFDVAVMPGLTAADDRTLVDAMQQMIDLPAFP